VAGLTPNTPPKRDLDPEHPAPDVASVIACFVGLLALSPDISGAAGASAMPETTAILMNEAHRHTGFHKLSREVEP
jgi:hypothetical protein